MKNILLIFLFFFNVVTIYCQSFSNKNNSEIVEKLIKKGDSIKNTDKVEALSTFKKGLAIALDNRFNEQSAVLYKKIGVLYHIKQDYTVAENHYRKGIQLDSISSTGADLFFNISLLKEIAAQQDSIIPYLQRSLVIYDDLELTKGACKVFLNAGVNYKDRQLYDKSLKYLIKAYKGFKALNMKAKLADVCSVIGNVQSRLHNHNQALHYYNEALMLQNSINNPSGLGRTYTNIANTLDNLKLYDSAVFYYQKSLKFLKPMSSTSATAIYNLADTYKSIGKTELAETNFKTSIKLNKTLKDTVSFLYGYNGIVSLYLEKNDLKNAKVYLDSLSSLALQVSDQIIALNFYENRAEYNYRKKRFKKAYEYQIKYSKLYKEIYNREQTEIVQNLHTQFDYERKENEIQKLSLSNENAQLLLSKKNENIRNKNLTVIILAIITLLVVVVYHIFLQKQKTAIQSTKIEKLEAIYDGQETIKKRIARDLHDIITTNFDGLRLRILALKRSSKVNEMVDEITGELKRMNQQIRTVSHRLHPLEMYMGKQKFTDIIKSRLSEFQLYGDIFVELENQLPKVLNTQPLAVQNNFYGIFLEVLNNVEKHSLATKIKIKNFKDSKNNTHFVFEDDGIGIENNHKEGIGLLNIRQRVEILEGNCTIKKIETGTQVHINFPIHTDS